MVEYVSGGEDPISYTDLINIFNYINYYGAKIWTFDKITSHRKFKDNPWGFKLLWYTVLETWDPMWTIK